MSKVRALPNVIHLPPPKEVKAGSHRWKPFNSKEELYEWLYRMSDGLRFYTAEERAEYKRAYNYIYNKRPEVKAAKRAYMAAWRKAPEVKAYEKAYRAAYRAIPEIRERDNALRKLRRLRAKARRGAA